MKRLHFLAVLFFAVAAHAQRVPTITSIMPNIGLYHGGDRVTIRGANFTSTCPILNCPNTKVLFGAYQAEVLSVMDDEVVVQVPPHRLGSVDVTMIRPDHVQVKVRSGYAYISGEEKEMVLLPLMMRDAAGANGSRWSTQVRINNRTDQAIPFSPTSLIVQPRSSIANPPQLLPAEGSGNPGRLLFLPRDHTDALSIQLRAQDLSRQSETFGVEIPVVHENDFRIHDLVLSEVPTTPGFRVAIRVYMLHEAEPGQKNQRFVVFAYDAASGEERVLAVLSDLEIATPSSDGTPGVGQVFDLTAELPAVRNVSAVRLRIAPLYLLPVVPVRFPLYWAFASVTHNETQHVTLVTPE